MTVKVFTTTLNALLKSGYLKKVHDHLPGLWFQLTKKGSAHVLDCYPRLPDRNDLVSYPFFRHFPDNPCHQPFIE